MCNKDTLNKVLPHWHLTVTLEFNILCINYIMLFTFMAKIEALFYLSHY